MKKLKKWLDQSKYSQNKFAEKLKISHSGLSRYINGSRKMPLSIAAKIEKLTDGEVTCQDLA